MIKKLLATLIATSSTLAFASGTSAPYVGISTGIVNNSASNGNIFRGMPVNIFAGYGAVLNQTIYLAGELTGTLGTFGFNNNNTVLGSSGLRSSYGYGVSFIPGFMLNDRTVAYARAGLVGTRFNNANKTVLGGQFGLGMQTTVMQNWELRGEYDYTTYRSFQNSSPRSDAFTMGLVYKID